MPATHTTILWPAAPNDPYFNEPSRVTRVHRRAVAIAEGREVEDYVAVIPARDKYLTRCVAVARKQLSRKRAA